MGLFDPLLNPAVSPGQPYPLHMSAAQAEQAKAVIYGLTDALRRTTATREESVSVNVGVAFDGLEHAVRSGFARTIRAVEAGTGEVTIGLDKLREGVAAIGADFHWAMGEVIWQLELQGRTLTELKARLDEPRGTKARELRRWAEQCHAGGLHEDAARFYHEAEALCPIDFIAQRSLGHLYLRAGDLGRALEYFRKAAKYTTLQDESLAAEAHLFAAQVCAAQENYPAACSECFEANIKAPRLHQAKFFYCQCAVRCHPDLGMWFPNELRAAILGDGRYAREAEADPVLACHPEARAVLGKLDRGVTACLRDQRKCLAEGRLPIFVGTEVDDLPAELKREAEDFRFRWWMAEQFGQSSPCSSLLARIDAALAADFCERLCVSQFLTALITAPDPAQET